MPSPSAASFRAVFLVVAASTALAACSSGPRVITRVKLSERECLARAMYFESNRSSDAGMLAVGTVVMNRLKSGKYGATVCEVVGAPRQFAPGVLTRPMNDRGAPRARKVADAVLSGRRHPGVQNAQFFHTAGYKFPYNNMRYVLVAGGNAFYDKTKPPRNWYGGEGRWGPPPTPTEHIAGGPIMVASVEVEHDAPAPAPTARRTVVTTETRVAEVVPARGGSVGGIPTYEAPPSARGAAPNRRGETVVASLEPAYRPRPIEVQPRRAAEMRPAEIREDNGLREEDRWRDQELAEDAGKPAATDDQWRDRRDRSVESAPLPVIETSPEPAPSRVASARRSRPVEVAPPVERDYADASYDVPPTRAERPAARPTRVANVAARSARPVEADPAALGWNVGAQPARTEADDPGYDAPLSRAAEQDGYMVDAPRRSAPSRPAPRRSYGGVALESGDEVGYGYR